jgi:hypothetical protein
MLIFFSIFLQTKLLGTYLYELADVKADAK